MSINRLELEYKEIPRTDLHIVIADDEKNVARYTAKAITQATTQQGITIQDLHTATGARDLLITALTGKNGKQADIVFLDHSYGQDINPWSLSNEEFTDLGKELGTDLTLYTSQVQLNQPSSVHFSTLLRIMGYQGNIFIVSSQPPRVGEFLDLANRIQDEVPSYRPTSLPVNGFVKKDSLGLDLDSVTWSRSIIPAPEYKWKPNEAYGLAQGMLGLLNYRP